MGCPHQCYVSLVRVACLDMKAPQCNLGWQAPLADWPLAPGAEGEMDRPIDQPMACGCPGQSTNQAALANDRFIPRSTPRCFRINFSVSPSGLIQAYTSIAETCPRTCSHLQGKLLQLNCCYNYLIPNPEDCQCNPAPAPAAPDQSR